uniref:Uncharacterized protein n=1 Tax=Anguilla anguilla TaxID=7936 RepID=A0A0E9XJD8_ANGAN
MVLRAGQGFFFKRQASRNRLASPPDTCSAGWHAGIPRHRGSGSRAQRGR